MADFVRVHPAGWPFNGTVSSAEANQLDINVSNALNRTGGTITGSIVCQHGSRLWVQGGRLSLDTDGTFASTLDVINGAITLSTANASMVVSAGGSISVLGGGTTGTVLIGSDGYLQVGSNGRLQLQNGSINTFQSGSSTTVAAGSTFEWAASQFPGLAIGHTGRTQTRKLHLGAYTISGTGWGYAASGNGIVGPTAGAGAAATGYLALPSLYQGATLSAVKLLFTPNVAHTALPATNINAAIQYRAPAAGVASALFTLGSSSSYSPVTLADYINGQVKSLTIACGTPTVDQAVNTYILSIVDEYGGASPLQTTFHALELTYTITDLHPN